MTPEQTRKIRWGHHLYYKGNRYVAIEYGIDATDGKIRCVLEDTYKRWRLIRAWIENGVIERMEDKELLIHEKKSYEIRLKFDNITSAEQVRIVDGDWEPLFTIDNFGKILLNGEEREIIFLDECHFELVKPGKTVGTVYHIHEFGELIKRHNADVRVEPGYLAALINDFGESFDFYGYRDSVDDPDENIDIIKECIQKRDVEGILDYLTEIVDHWEGAADDRAEAKRLILMLKPYQKKKEVKAV